MSNKIKVDGKTKFLFNFYDVNRMHHLKIYFYQLIDQLIEKSTARVKN